MKGKKTMAYNIVEKSFFGERIQITTGYYLKEFRIGLILSKSYISLNLYPFHLGIEFYTKKALEEWKKWEEKFLSDLNIEDL